MLCGGAFTGKLVKLLPVWLISQCFISVRKHVKWNRTDSVHCINVLSHTCVPNTVTGSTPQLRPSDMAKTHRLIIMLFVFFEILSLTDSKGKVKVTFVSTLHR